MIVVTGGAGFIGSNLVRALNARGRDDVLVETDSITNSISKIGRASSRQSEYI